MMCRRLSALVALVMVLVGYAPLVANADGEWARFRGPNGTGISDLQGVPTSWNRDDYEWEIELPGVGHSSPIIWGNQLFLTCGQQDGSRLLMCLDATNGKMLWADTTMLDPSHLHEKNSYASGTPVTDGERVYVAFADDNHYRALAYTMQGERLWSRDLGGFTSQHGFGISPIVYKGMLILPNDQMGPKNQKGPSTVMALDAASGKDRWVTPRKNVRASYATPMILNVEGHDQLITLSGAIGIASLDPLTGRELWATGEMPQRTVASPVAGNGLVIGSCGNAGRGVYMVAANPAAQSDATLIQGERTQNLPYVPTPIVFEDYLYLWNDDGIVCCVDLKGDLSANVWRQRIGGNFSGSPVVIGGKLYCMSEDGNVTVLDASPKFKNYGKSPLVEPTYSTPAVANGRVYLRTFSHLASLKAKSANSGSE